MFEVSSFGESDADQWVKLWSSYEGDIEPKEVIQKSIEQNWPRILNDNQCHAKALRLKETGVAVGFVTYATHWCAFSDKDECYMSGLFVLPEWREKGGGKLLINSVIEFSKKNNLERVTWLTRSNNKEAIRIYDKLAQAQEWTRYKVEL